MSKMEPMSEALLTNSDYETIVEELRTENYLNYASPIRIDQIPGNMPYEETMIKQFQRHRDMAPPPLEYNGKTIENVTEPVVETTSSPEVSPSPYPTGIIPSRDEYRGPLEFEILLDSTTANKKSWMYSMKLHKVFIDMNKSLLIQFRLREYTSGLVVRAMPVYSQDDFVSIPVQRCVLHVLADDVYQRAHAEEKKCFCAKYNMVRHVLRSNHPLAQYDYDCESDRHSVLVPVETPQSGSDTVVVEYHFTCKTSCPRGMNRRPIEVIFTLENNQCEVIGRVILPVKICSCPKRDKEREEIDAAANPNSFIPGPGKRRISQSKADEKQEVKKIKKESINNHNIQNGQAQPSELSEIVKKIDKLEKMFESQRASTEKIIENQRALIHMHKKLEEKFDNGFENLGAMTIHVNTKSEENFEKVLENQRALTTQMQEVLNTMYGPHL